MKPEDAPEIDLPTGIHPTQRTDWRVWLSGGVFCAGVGFMVLLLSYRSLATEPAMQSISLGIMIGSIAMMLYGGDLKRIRMQQQRLKKRYPGEPWTWDFLNNELSMSDGALKRAATIMLIAIGIVIVSLPYCWAFYRGTGNTYGVSFMSISMIVVAVGIGTIAVYEMFVLRKFGASRLEFRRFPFRLGSILDVRLKTARAFGTFERMVVTLICVREEILNKGQKGQELIFRELYRDQLYLAPQPDYDPALPLDLALILELPQGDFGTRMDSAMPRYWILNVASKGAGLEYSTAFRVPVYA